MFGNVLCILSEGVKTRDNKIIIVTDYSGGNLKNYNIARIVDEERLCFKFSVYKNACYRTEVTFRSVTFLASLQSRTKLSSQLKY